MKRQLLALTLCVMLVYLSSGFACSRQSMLSASRDVVSALTDCKPLLQQAGIATDKIDLAITWGNKLVAALESGTTTGTDVVSIASNLISTFNAIAADTNLIVNPRTKMLVMVSLGIANIALHYISNHIEQQASGRLGVSHTVAMFNRQAAWRCRNAQSGKFEKMGWCKAHPDVSVVETR